MCDGEAPKQHVHTSTQKTPANN